MTTTTSNGKASNGKASKGKAAPAPEQQEQAAGPVVGDDDFDDGPLTNGEKVTGGFDGPHWMPHLVEKNERRQKEALAKLAPGSTVRPTMKGRLVVASAWGRKLYFIDATTRSGEVVRFHVPEQATLYRALNTIKVGAVVFVEYKGLGQAKPGQNAPFIYDVSAEKGAALGEERADKLTIKRRDDDKGDEGADAPEAPMADENGNPV